jgi:ABC-type nitrate/sulfonate/bicarbonate transport system substrate-binding protein
MHLSLIKKFASAAWSLSRYFTLAGLVIALSAPQALAAAPLTPVLMTTGAFSEREGVVFVAQDQGFFRKYGLDVRFVHVRSGPVGMAALSAGESQLHVGSVTGATLGAVAEGSDAAFVAGLINKLTGTIMVNSKIRTPADLKGKALGVSSMSGGSWIFTMLALDYWGFLRNCQFRIRAPAFWRGGASSPLRLIPWKECCEASWTRSLLFKYRKTKSPS